MRLDGLGRIVPLDMRFAFESGPELAQPRMAGDDRGVEQAQHHVERILAVRAQHAQKRLVRLDVPAEIDEEMDLAQLEQRRFIH